MKSLTLDNGLRCLLMPTTGTDAVTLLVLIKVGSRYEDAELNGASHFIEHLMFKGTKRRPNTLDISRALDAVGAEYNAYTGKDLTGYYVKAAGEHFPLAVDMLHDMLFHSTYKSEEMNRERKVIIEEINMYEDNPLMYVEDILEEAMFEGNTLGWHIAGTRQGMIDMPRQRIIAYRDQHYVPSRMVIAVAGKLSKDVVELLDRTFGKIPNHQKEPASFSPFGELPKRTRPRVRIQDKKVEQVQVAFGWPSVPMNHKEETPAKLLATVLGGSMSSRLFVAVRERRGLAYLVRASGSSYEDTGIFTVQAGLDKSRLPLATKTIMQELRDVVKHGVKAEELRRAKDYVRGKTMLALEDSSSRAEWYAKQQLFLGEAKSPEERLKEMDRVTGKQVQAIAAKIFDPGRLCVSGIGPFGNERNFLKQLSL